ncbi:hypothetical protein KC932_19595, partial [Proteus mirabilis]|uniref:hypothetical protein n=1 Tax=Proteus mirabilis TaxID=584 RepID=UPI003315A9A8
DVARSDWLYRVKGGFLLPVRLSVAFECYALSHNIQMLRFGAHGLLQLLFGYLSPFPLVITVF